MHTSEDITPRDEPTNIGGIDYPDELIRALLERRLVVFAGAGVSMGAPAFLPDFDGLVQEIAAGTGLTKGTESHDRFLGVLESKGVDVHRRAARKLSNRCTQLTPLHCDLVRLAGPIDGTLIVTTNFDALFEGAEAEIGMRVPAFNAPALPLGSSFSGIVHLHGSLDEPEGMVLTDADVGRAYITQGWARRFLVQLFASHTVLFVGYSHNDTIPEYLARAMPSVQPQDDNPQPYGRYILTDSEDNERWTRLGIEPIEYPERDHLLLGNSLSRLAKHMSRDLVAWDAELANVASSGPLAGPEQLESVRIALRKVDTTRRFGVHAHGTEWLGWLDQAGYLGNLFNDGELTPLDLAIGWWVAIRFVKSDTGSLNELIEAKDGVIHLQFWMMLAQLIAGTKEVVSEERKRLVRTLSEDPPPQVPGLILQSFVESASANADYNTAATALLYAIRILLGLRRRTDSMFNVGPMLMANKVDAYGVSASWHILTRARDEIADRVLDGICKALEEREEYRLAVSRSSVRSSDLDRPSKWSRRMASSGAGIGMWAKSTFGETTVDDCDPVAVLRRIILDCLESLRVKARTALNERVLELTKSGSSFVKDIVFEHILTAHGEQPERIIDCVAWEVATVARVEDLFVKFVETAYPCINQGSRRRVLALIWGARSKSILDIHTWFGTLATHHSDCQVAQEFATVAHQERLQWSAEPIQNQKERASSPTSKRFLAKAAASIKSGQLKEDTAVESVDATSIDFPEHLVELKKLLQRHQDLYSRFSVWFDHMETHGIESLQRGAFETELVRSDGFKCVAPDVARIYLATGEHPDLYLFYGAIQVLLKESEPGHVKRIWDEWLGELFASRCEGVPTPVERIEAWFMFSLSRFLIPSVPSVVDKLTQLSGECNEFLEPHHSFRKADVEASPEQYGRMLVHIGNHNESKANWFRMHDNLDTLVAHPALSDELKRQLNGVRLKLGLDQPE